MENKKVINEISNTLRLINYNRGLTILENNSEVIIEGNEYPVNFGNAGFNYDGTKFNDGINYEVFKSNETKYKNKCQPGFSPIDPAMVKNYFKMLDNPLTDTKNHTFRYYQLPDGNWCEKQIIGDIDYENVQDKVFDMLHYLLPMLGIAAMIFVPPPAGFIIAGLLDIADAGIFLVEDDQFNAGLTIAFLIIPGHQLTKLLGLGGLPKKAIMLLLDKVSGKLGKKAVLTLTEKGILEKLNTAVIRGELIYYCFLGMVNTILSRSILGKFLKFLIYLINKGYLLGGFLLKFGIQVGTIYYTWIQIAKFYGIEEKELEVKSVDQITTKTESLKETVIKTFIFLKDGSYVLSLKNETSFNLGVLYLQLYLVQSKNNIITYEVDDSKLSTRDKLKQMDVHFGIKPLFDYSNQLTSGNYRGAGVKTGPEFLKMKWGFYDKNTEESVKTYQRKHFLNSDGKVGLNTFSQLINDIKKESKIINSSGIDILKKIDELETKKINKKPITQEIIKTIEIQYVNAKTKKQILDSLTINIEPKLIKLINEVDLEKISQDTTKFWN